MPVEWNWVENMGLAVGINVVVGSEMVESDRVGIADGAFVVVEQAPRLEYQVSFFSLFFIYH